MPNRLPSSFHLHLISDATGETLTTMAKAAAVQYSQVRPIEHVHPLVRTAKQLERVLKEVEHAPGIVLYTIVNKELIEEIEQRCRDLKVPALHVLKPIMNVFESYLGAPQTPVVAGQHIVDADYFRRIDALNFSMAHDDGQLPQDLNAADIIILGISRTSKTPTSIYLAQRGYKTANLPLVPGIDLPPALTEPHSAFVVGLVASPERIAEIRRNRVRLMSDRNLDDYVDRTQIANEINYSRRLCARHGWPIIDVTRRSIEETAATIIRLLARSRGGRRSPSRTGPRMRELVLASTSPFRRRMLQAAGLSFSAVAPEVDESVLKRELASARPPAGASDVAAALARAKALAVSARMPSALVIGADQVLALGDELFDKPGDRPSARDQLQRLRGRQHQLHTAAALAEGGDIVWSRIEVATLHMRAFSDAYLDDYLAEAGPSMFSTVGGYEIEGRGIQLFERVEGDHFTIIGLPLLPLLAELRDRGVIAT